MLAMVRIVRRLLRSEFLKAKGMYLRMARHLDLKTAEAVRLKHERVAQVQR